MAKQTERLDIEVDERFQRREWKLQRIGWVIWGLLVVAALLGLLGPGPLSHRTARAADESLELNYDRFVRHHHSARLRIRLQSSKADEKKLMLKLNEAFMSGIKIQRIEPEPVQSYLEPDGTVFVFELGEKAEAGKVVFHYEQEQFGSCEGRIELLGHSPVEFSQFTYP